jgi:hypothetical protein
LPPEVEQADLRGVLPIAPPSLHCEALDVGESPIYLPYSAVRNSVRHGDLLLKRAIAPSLIAAAGRTIYSHAAMAAWWDDRLMAIEMVEFIGGRAVLFSNHVKKLPGRWDVYTANAGDRWHWWDRNAAVDRMREFTATPYGWWNIARASLRHLAIVRLFVRPPTDDKANGSAPFCSQAYSLGCIAGGVDPVPHLSSAATEPGDLARSPFFQYRCTLNPDDLHDAHDNQATVQRKAA